MKKRALEKGELGFVVILGIIGLICFIASLRIFVTAPTLNGEGTVPLITSIVLLVMSGVMVFEVRDNPRGFEKGTALGVKVRELLQYLFPGKVGIIVVYCIVYCVLLNVLGFAVSTTVFLVGSMITLNKEKKLRSFLVSVITMACILILFQYIFKVQLP